MNIPSPISQIKSDFLKQHELELCLKRDDLIHPYISGNKWRKLKYNFLEAESIQAKGILTFGGAYSNHIAATAAAGKKYKLPTVGIIRGDEQAQNHTLDFAREQGMHIEYISREDYRKKDRPEFLSELKQKWAGYFVIPEGGANEFGVMGCAEIMEEVQENFDYVCCSAGTGTTASGLVKSMTTGKVLIFPALKSGVFLAEEINKYAGAEGSAFEIMADYHFGAYAKINEELIQFYDDFKAAHQIELDLVYTAKMMFGIYDLIRKGYFPPSSRILALHTGGVQGNLSLLKKFRRC